MQCRMHKTIIEKLDSSLKEDDIQLCNYLLIEHVDFSKNKLENIYNILSKKYTEEEGLYLIFAALFHLGIEFHIDNFCPKFLARKMHKNISKQRWFFIKLYLECTDAEITVFFRELFNKSFVKPRCVSYLEQLSEKNIVFDDNFRMKVEKFAETNNIPMLKKYLEEFDNGIEYDGKRQRLSNNQVVADPARLFKVYKIKRNRENLCLVYCNNRRRNYQLDAEKINNTFSQLSGFTVKINPLTTKQALFRSLEDHSKNISKKSDMIVSFFLADTNDGSFCDQEGNSITHDEIMTIFKTICVPQLGGKPRIFFIDVTWKQEDNKSSVGENVSSTDSRAEFDGLGDTSVSGKCHVDIGDYLFCFSKQPASSPQNANNGSRFINRLCDLISQYSTKKCLRDIFMMIKRGDPELSGDQGHPCEIIESITNDIFLAERTL